MSIKLFNASGSHELFTSSQSDLLRIDTYTQADVAAGKWILYMEKDNNEHLGNGAKEENIKVIAEPGLQKIDTVNGSLLHVPDNSDAIVLYQYSYYGGKHKVSENTLLSSNIY